MKNKLLLIPLFAISVICFNGCSSAKTTIEITNSINEGEVINPKDVVIKETYYSIEEKRFYNQQVLPSIGNVNLLVIPILLPGDYKTIDLDNDGTDDKEKVRQDINEVFFGKKNKKYESVSAFYKKSSFDKLNLGGIVTEWFDVEEHTNYTNAAEIDYYQTYDLVSDAVNWVKETQDINILDYDSDKDGYIDGVWCIYSCPNYQNGGPQTDYGNYWAYTTWGNQSTEMGEYPDVNNPIYNLFGWASYDFMYDGYGTSYVDAHTYIHETGHFLGLNDYYSDQMSYNPIGKVDMMDANITDHNSYSKMLLGWTKPYIVTGNATINLSSIAKENSFIVIPGDSVSITNNEFDPFSEYILIELYEPTGLNEKDSKNKYSNSLQGINSTGVKIYHIDNRKYIVNADDIYNITCSEYNNEEITDDRKLILPITNKRGLDAYNSIFNFDINYNLYDEIRLIEATNIDTFTSGGRLKDVSLFYKDDVFSLEEYGKNFFLNNQKFNNGDNFSYHIEIKEVK